MITPDNPRPLTDSGTGAGEVQACPQDEPDSNSPSREGYQNGLSTTDGQVPSTMRNARRWLLWKKVPNKDPRKKPRKVPFYASGEPRKGTLDASTDVAKLSTYEEARAALRRGGYAGLGFALGPDGTGNCWQGIDLDGVSDHEGLETIAANLPGYTETSPSGVGCHAIGYGRTFKTLGSNASGIEAYAEGRFFTFTGRNPAGEPTCIASFVEQELAPRWKAAAGPVRPVEAPAKGSSGPLHSDGRNLLLDLESALGAIPADDYALWVRMGLALKGLGEPGRELWIAWSQKSEKFDGAEASRTWDGLTPREIDHRSVFTEAADRGWDNPSKGQVGGRFARMNDQFCVVSARGKARVVSMEAAEEGERETIVYQAFEDFRKLNDHRRVPIGDDKTMGEGSWWLAQSRRRQYASVVFRPGKPREVPDGRGNLNLNLWRGWGVEPQPGDWPLLRRHIHEVLAAGDQTFADYLIKWTAWTFQNPGSQAEVALVFRGAKGTGKGFWGRLMKSIFGQHGHQISSPKNLTGNFNAHLMDCALLFADEAFWAGDKGAEGQLKRIITEPTLFIEPKGIDAFEVRNCLHIIMVTNDDWAVPASIDERRFAVSDVATDHVDSKAYFRALKAEIDGGGAAAMLFDLLALNLEGWHPRDDVPQTAALADQKLRSLKPEDEWWLALLHEGRLPGVEQGGDPAVAPASALYHHARSTVPGLSHMHDPILASFLKKRGCDRPGADLRLGGRRAWRFPPLLEARRAWAARLPTEWENPDARDWGDAPDWEPAPY